MAKVSIHRALQLVKSLTQRIDREISEASFMGVTRGADNVVVIPERTTKNKDALLVQFTGELKSINDMIAIRELVKTRIAQSNAVTKITVNAQEITVQQAIEMKQSIQSKEVLLSALIRQRALAVQNYVRLSDEVERYTTQRLETLNGKQSTVKATAEDEKLARKAAENTYQPMYIDPLGLNDVIDQLTKEIDDFKSDIDATLSESNARTEIEIN